MAEIYSRGPSLAEILLFRDLPAETIADLESVTRYRRFAIGDLVLAGEPGSPHDLFVVLEGLIEVVRGFGAADALQLAEVGPGGWFVEFAMIDGRAGSARARVREPALVAVVPRETMMEMLATQPTTGLRMLERMVRLIRNLDDCVAQHHDVDSRIDELHRQLVRLIL